MATSFSNIDKINIWVSDPLRRKTKHRCLGDKGKEAMYFNKQTITRYLPLSAKRHSQTQVWAVSLKSNIENQIKGMDGS